MHERERNKRILNSAQKRRAVVGEFARSLQST